jgi:hypothetical protein
MKMPRREFLLGAGAAFLLTSESAKVLAAVEAQDGSTPIGAAAPGVSLYPPQLDNENFLLEQCAPFLLMNAAEIAALAPPQGGFSYCGCPNCDGGTGDNNIGWNVALGEKVQCRFCNEILPSEKYPENKQVEIQMPVDGVQVFKYYQSADGKKYWFQARRWFEQRTFLEKGAYALAQLFRVDPMKYAEAGKKSAAILERFAEVYPNYIIKYEYPSREKFFITGGNSAEDLAVLGNQADYAAKWSSWGYTDLSASLLLAYDQLATADFMGADSRRKIETALLGGMANFVGTHGALPVNNMSPALWRAQAIAANVLRRPEIAANILPAMRGLLREGFTYDGFWEEGTVSYHQQTAGGFQNVFDALYPPASTLTVEAYWARIPLEFRRALRANDIFRLPNKKYAAINDTWASENYRGERIEKSTPHLMPGLGYSILGLGEKENQGQAHLKWSGRFGHHHFDSLNLLLFARGKELVSDLGYTHTKARGWASSTAAHSTVLVDEKNQAAGEAPFKARGDLLLFCAHDPNFQATEAKAEDAYPNLVSQYRRALLSVQISDDVRYIVDIFQVEGGSRHDWILHGSADENQEIELRTESGEQLAQQPIPSLLPADFKFEPAQREGDLPSIFNGPWALGHFRDIAQGRSDATVIATFREKSRSSGGLQSWILNAPQSTFSTARSWNVRGAAEDQAKLDDFLRASLIVRRNGAANRFVAVHVPFEKESPVRRVTQLSWPGNGVALKIETANATDYVLYQPDGAERTGKIENHDVRFSGRCGQIRIADNQTTLKMIGGGKLQFGKHAIGSTALAAPLLQVQDNAFTVRGRFEIAPGEIIIIRHGDGRTSAFHVAKIQTQGGSTVIETQEPPTLAGDAKGALKMLFSPHADLAGPHLVTADVLTTGYPDLT